MRRALAFSLTLSLIGAPVFPSAAATPDSRIVQRDQDPQGNQDNQGDQGYVAFSNDQLENLVAPIALYPDPLLSQVLIAATFVDDVDEAG
ncbi:MAG TPA: DUF3300 domain-containing protein, partial [Blastocatellia bacterium]|nr:DUF3300 domain-containing protein [Blastocatellia bacterium]